LSMHSWDLGRSQLGESIWEGYRIDWNTGRHLSTGSIEAFLRTYSGCWI
jgi:hypothetical protein